MAFAIGQPRKALLRQAAISRQREGLDVHPGNSGRPRPARGTRRAAQGSQDGLARQVVDLGVLLLLCYREHVSCVPHGDRFISDVDWNFAMIWEKALG